MYNEKVVILLSTYNGSLNIIPLLNSLLNQTYHNIHIYIRDDCSSDDTPKIITRYAQNHPEKIKIIDKDERKNIGVRLSFERLMLVANKSNYFAFCDQDDIWEKNKIELLMNKIKQLEFQNEKMPLLVFSDMLIFKNDKNILIPSYIKYIRLDKNDLNNGLFRGLISGCLMLFNSIALEKYFKNNRLHLHDHNMIMSTYLYGKIDYVPEKLIQYRIHDNNYFGLTKLSPFKYDLLDLGKYLFNNREYRKIALKSYFDFTLIFVTNENSKICILKEIFTSEQVDELTYFKRKKWYLKHFKPFGENPIRGLVKLILI